MRAQVHAAAEHAEAFEYGAQANAQLNVNASGVSEKIGAMAGEGASASVKAKLQSMR